MGIMKALSLRKPWADLIFSGKKTIELRTWTTKLKLPFEVLIQTSSNIDVAGVKEYGEGSLPRGAIVGKVTIVGIKKYSSTEEFLSDSGKHCDNDLSWYKPGSTYGFILQNPKLLPKPIPYKGRLGFFDVDI